MKELWRKKSVKAALAVIVILVVVGIVSLSVQSSQRRKDYNGHIDAAEKYLTELNYEQAIAEYTLALEIEPNSKEILNALEEVYLAYAQTYVDIEEYESAIEILKRGYEQTGRESLWAKIEELTNLLAQKEEEERERLLAEEEAEKQRLLEEEEERERLLAEEEKRQKLLAEAQGQETADDEEEETEEIAAPAQVAEMTMQADERSDMVAAYQAKASEYIFAMQKERYDGLMTGTFYDARMLRTQAEFYEFFNNPPSPVGVWFAVGALETSLLEETESQCRILVTDMVFYTDMESCWIEHFEIIIDKAAKQGTIANIYGDRVEIFDFLGSRGEVLSHDIDGDPNWLGRVFDFSE